MAIDYENKNDEENYLLSFIKFPDEIYSNKLKELILKEHRINNSEIDWENDRIQASICLNDLDINLLTVLISWINKVPDSKGILKLERKLEKEISGTYEFYPKKIGENNSVEIFCIKRRILENCILCGNKSSIQAVKTKYFTLKVDCENCGSYLYSYLPGNQVDRKFVYFYKIFGVNPNEIIKLVKKYNSRGDLYQLKEMPK
jgi:hypothetical protein